MSPKLLLLLTFPFLPHAHMQLSEPKALGSKFNPNVKNIDYELHGPIRAPQFPCKNYHSDPSRGANVPVATWPAGSRQRFAVVGGASHGGGSCQASFSVDGGATWRVARSYVGGCPGGDGASYEFTVPAGMPSGVALFAWTWFNRIGNREMYMNCAVVEITGGGQVGAAGVSAVDALPELFTANLGDGGCGTIEMKDLDFPNPGSNVVRFPQASPAAPVGVCKAGGVSTGGSGSPPPASGGGDNSGIIQCPVNTATVSPNNTTVIDIGAGTSSPTDSSMPNKTVELTVSEPSTTTTVTATLTHKRTTRTVTIKSGILTKTTTVTTTVGRSFSDLPSPTGGTAVGNLEGARGTDTKVSASSSVAVVGAVTETKAPGTIGFAPGFGVEPAVESNSAPLSKSESQPTRTLSKQKPSERYTTKFAFPNQVVKPRDQSTSTTPAALALYAVQNNVTELSELDVRLRPRSSMQPFTVFTVDLPGMTITLYCYTSPPVPLPHSDPTKSNSSVQPTSTGALEGPTLTVTDTVTIAPTEPSSAYEVTVTETAPSGTTTEVDTALTTEGPDSNTQVLIRTSFVPDTGTASEAEEVVIITRTETVSTVTETTEVTATSTSVVTMSVGLLKPGNGSGGEGALKSTATPTGMASPVGGVRKVEVTRVLTLTTTRTRNNSVFAAAGRSVADSTGTSTSSEGGSASTSTLVLEAEGLDVDGWIDVGNNTSSTTSHASGSTDGPNLLSGYAEKLGEKVEENHGKTLASFTGVAGRVRRIARL